MPQGKPLTTVREVRAYEREISDFRGKYIKAIKLASCISDNTDPVMARDIELFVDESLAGFHRARDIEYPPKSSEPTTIAISP